MPCFFVLSLVYCDDSIPNDLKKAIKSKQEKAVAEIIETYGPDVKRVTFEQSGGGMFSQKCDRKDRSPIQYAKDCQGFKEHDSMTKLLTPDETVCLFISIRIINS